MHRMTGSWRKKKVYSLCAAIYFSIFSFSCDQYLFLQSNLLSQNIVAALGLLSRGRYLLVSPINVAETSVFDPSLLTLDGPFPQSPCFQ